MTTKCEFLKLKTKDIFIPLTGEVVGGIDSPIGASFAPLVNISSAELVGKNSYNRFVQWVNGENNIVDLGASKISVIGSDNVVSADAKSIIITGNNNYISAGIENVQLINTNNVKVTDSNVIYVNGRQTSGNGTIFLIENSFLDVKWALDIVYKGVEVDLSINTFDINLPTAIGLDGEEFTIKNTSLLTDVNVNPIAGETIDGANVKVVKNINTTLVIYSNGRNWKIK